jgi:dimeric dUTPase (all-alpha-NTP-PPase superfamily)
LLDEYVDGLHFILELGLEIGYKNNYDLEFPYSILGDGVNWFSSTYGSIIDFSRYKGEVEYVCLVNDYLGLGRCLGFEWQQIEEAYFAKNQINHERQDNGY